MTQPTAKDPLHGITLEKLLTALLERLGWEELGRRVPIRCFRYDPSIKSSLTFLRRTPWARAKVEAEYLALNRNDAVRNHEARQGPRRSGVGGTLGR